jgi:hypothetical protein
VQEDEEKVWGQTGDQEPAEAAAAMGTNMAFLGHSEEDAKARSVQREMQVMGIKPVRDVDSGADKPEAVSGEKVQAKGAEGKEGEQGDAKPPLLSYDMVSCVCVRDCVCMCVCL